MTGRDLAWAIAGAIGLGLILYGLLVVGLAL